jgi:hypothetical protein
LDLAAHSQREQGYADTRWSIPGWGWANFLVPMVFGHVWSMGVFFQYDQGWTSSYYLGIGTLLLALLAVWLVRERRVWVLAAAAGLALCLSFGNQNVVYRGLRSLLPQISLMTYPVKFVTMVVFISPLLAGFALAHLQRLKNSGRSGANRRLLLLGAMLLALIGGILIWAWRWPFPTDDFPATLRNGLGRAGFLAASVAVLVLCSSRREEAPSFHSALRTPHSALSRASSRRLLQSLARVLPLLLLLVLWLDVWTHEPAQNPGVEPMVYTPDLARAKLAMKPQPELGQSRVMLAPATALKFIQFVISNPRQNFLAKRAGYFADCNLLDHVPKVDGFFSLYPRESGELISTIYGTTNAAFPHLADFLAVSYVTAPGDYINWVARQSWLPPATAGQRPIFLDDSQALSALLRPDFDGRRVVIFPPSARTSMAVTNESDAQVNIRSWQNRRVELDVQASKASLVVVSQSYYHNWRAYVDGRPTELFRANYAFQAVQAPEGHHQVTLAYEDRAICIGAWISGLSLAACLAALWLSRRFRRP